MITEIADKIETKENLIIPSDKKTLAITGKIAATILNKIHREKTLLK